MNTETYPFPGVSAGAATSPRARRGFSLKAVFATLLAWQDRDRQRRSLAEMPDRILRDIGITRADALREAMKPFWRP